MSISTITALSKEIRQTIENLDVLKIVEIFGDINFLYRDI